MRKLIRATCILLIAALTSFLFASYAGAEDERRVALSYARGVRGGNAVMTLTGENVSGVAAFKFRISWDARLTLESIDACELLADGTLDSKINSAENSATFLWYNVNGGLSSDGELVKLTFRVPSDAEGTYPVSLTYDPDDILDSDVKPLEITASDGKVGTFIYGDADDDNDVDVNDLVRIKRYFAEYDAPSGSSTVEIGPGADANGDTKVTSLDVIRLKKYFASEDFSVILGPA